jgi:predicted Zn-dependent protease
MIRQSLLSAAVALSLTCARNPATGQRELMLVSEGQEIAMGREADPGIVAQMGLVPDSGLQRYVRELGLRLAASSERPRLPWTFRVLDDPLVNAFALPGGFIYVTRGILAHMNSEAELVAVLGHEVGHVTARHSAAQMSKAQLAGVGLVVGTIVEPGFAQYANVASQGLGLLFLKFGRDDERQADDLGLRYMRRTGHDARQMAGVFSMLARVSQAAGGGGSVPTWLSTHPDPEDRRGRIERAVAALPAESLGTRVNRAGYLQQIDGMVYGPNPREGFFRGAEFVHPDLQFRLAFPAGWRASNQRQSVAAMSPNEDALLQLTVESQATTPEAAARAFFGQQGVEGFPGAVRINGLPAQAGEFLAATQGGTVAGRVAWVAYGGAVYRLIGYTARARWSGYAATIERTLGSFDRLTDPVALRVQPQRVTVVTVPRAMTLAEFAAAYPGPVPVAELARVNNVDETARFAAGDRVKRVIGERLPS